jgi:hypothetical protein
MESAAAATGKVVQAHANQRNNPLLRYITQVRIQFQAELAVDYQVSHDIGVVFIR